MVYLYASYVEKLGKWVRNIRHGGGRWSNISTTDWEECVTFLTPKPGDKYIRLSISLAEQVDGVNHAAWIDDVYFGEGRGFEQPPMPKMPFNGTQTRVDELGNIEILRDGKWEPFFPLFMYADHTRPENDEEGWKVYSRHVGQQRQDHSASEERRFGFQSPRNDVRDADCPVYLAHWMGIQ